ncbi:MAG: hypothetical protein ABFS86_16360 [Planctomycetota bacterium]
MKIVGSIVKIQGERIALVAVQKDVLEFSSEADQYVDRLSQVFEGLPVVLMGQDPDGAKYYGRDDLVKKLGTVDPNQVPWQEIEAEL